MKRKNWTNTDAQGLSDTRDKSILMLDPKALAIWCAGLSGLVRSSNQINQKNKTDEMNQSNQMNQIPATRRERGSSICS